MRLFGPVQQGGRFAGGAGRGRMALMKVNADFPCAQNILKRVEERSERECTALDAHKELELVSGLPLPAFPNKPLPRLDSPSRPCSLACQCGFGKCKCTLVFAFATQRRCWGRTTGQVWPEHSGMASFSTRLSVTTRELGSGRAVFTHLGLCCHP